METLIQIGKSDRQLLAGIADVMAEAARRSGEWLVCRPGCTQCCIGPFVITQLDVLRLREGLSALSFSDPARAERVRTRAAEYVMVIGPDYPGNPVTGELEDEDGFPAFMDEMPCPALDPATGCCDLYSARPVTCRSFGPVTRIGIGAFAACELCYGGATDEQIAECAVEVDPEGRESELLAALDEKGFSGMTIVAYALAHGSDDNAHPA